MFATRFCLVCLIVAPRESYISSRYPCPPKISTNILRIKMNPTMFVGASSPVQLKSHFYNSIITPITSYHIYILIIILVKLIHVFKRKFVYHDVYSAVRYRENISFWFTLWICRYSSTRKWCVYEFTKHKNIIVGGIKSDLHKKKKVIRLK